MTLRSRLVHKHCTPPLDTFTLPTRAFNSRAIEATARSGSAIDLRLAYGRNLWLHATQLEVTLRGHAMASPDVGFLSRPGLNALRDVDGPIVFAHSDLSGLSLFEEASYWGMRAAGTVLA